MLQTNLCEHFAKLKKHFLQSTVYIYTYICAYIYAYIRTRMYVIVFWPIGISLFHYYAKLLTIHCLLMYTHKLSNNYTNHIVQKFDKEKLWTIKHAPNLNRQSVDKLVIGSIGERQVFRETFDILLAICLIY